MTKTQISEILASAKCFCGLNKKQNAGVQAYLLALIKGLSTDVSTLASAAACYQCFTKPQQDIVFAYIIQQFSGATGTPQQILNSSPCITCIPPGMLEAFKTNILYIIARATNPATAPNTPGEAVIDANEFVNLDPTILPSVLLYVGHYPTPNPPFVPTYDCTLCETVITGGGGDSFDCHTIGDMVDWDLENCGTAFSGNWIFGDSMVNVYGDSFDFYTVGFATLLNGGTGFSFEWYFIPDL